MNLSEHPIYQNIYDLCVEIEKLPASEQETKVVVMAADLEKPVAKLLKELKDLKSKAEAMQKALRYVAYQRLPLGNTVIETLPGHWQVEVLAALEERQ